MSTCLCTFSPLLKTSHCAQHYWVYASMWLYFIYIILSDTNDGGCVNDKQLRDFTNYYSAIPRLLCTEDSPCEEMTHNVYSEASQKIEHFTYTVINPTFGGSMKGIQILKQLVPYITSTIQVR